MDLQESQMEEEHDVFEKGQREVEAYKATMRQHVEAAEQAERRVKGHLRDYKERLSGKDKSNSPFCILSVVDYLSLFLFCSCRIAEAQNEQLAAETTKWKDTASQAQEKADELQKAAEDWRQKTNEDREQRQKAEAEILEVRRQLKATQELLSFCSIELDSRKKGRARADERCIPPREGKRGLEQLSPGCS